ncbi:MAG TPA: IPTL-CTERM sorting domain-containing protein [Candidatus Dormibacteraeota bacterium]|nr:IPTL-CTERM sorting domain-containing protein [Candidatus Dormibacteraeota bacterium]
MMRRKAPILIVTATLTVLGLGRAKADLVAVSPGYDLFETDSGSTYDDLNLPAGTFAPFCAAGFVGRIFLKGVPFDCFQGHCRLEPTDTIVQRLAAATPPLATIPIKIVRLELRSVSPLVVQCAGGDQQWEMSASVPEGDVNQTNGSMTINHLSNTCGTFTSSLPVKPTLTFRRVSDGSTVGPLLSPTTFTFTVPKAGTSIPPWCHTGGVLDDPVGDVLIQVPGLSSNFFPGVNCSPPPGGGGGPIVKVLTEEEAQQAQHGVLPAEMKPHYKCFNIVGTDPPDVVNLQTQFGFTPNVPVGQATLLCPPATKRVCPSCKDEGDLNAPHLKCYDIAGPAPNPPVHVDLTSEFGLEKNVLVGAPQKLCVPALKEVVFPTPIPAPPGPPPPAPHYTCYTIAGAAPPAVVDLQTQFGIEPSVAVGPPQLLCAPTLKNGQGDLNDPHLKCYQIAGDDPPHIVNLTTQFGLESNVAVGQARLICVPVKKVHTPAVPTLSQWGLMALALLLVTSAATVFFRSVRQKMA